MRIPPMKFHHFETERRKNVLCRKVIWSHKVEKRSSEKYESAQKEVAVPT